MPAFSDKNSLSAIVLAGGKSSRMGVDKAWLSVQGVPMIRHVLQAVEQVVDQVIIIANDPQYETLGYPVYPDLIPDTGPMGGIYTGLKHSNTQKNLVLACDTPFLNLDLLRKLIQVCGNEWFTVAQLNNRPEPLFAIYDRSALELFRVLLDQQDYKLQRLYESAPEQYKTVDFTGILADDVFKNINTPEDLNMANRL